MTTTLVNDTATLSPKIRGLLSKGGQIISLRTIRDMKVRKGCASIQKDATYQCRIGIDYNKIQNVMDKREVGLLPAENAGLPYGEWAVFPYLIISKGVYQLRCTMLRNNVIPKVRYLRNGIEITKEEAIVDCLASEFREGERDNDVFNVKVDNIVAINGELI